MSSQSHLFCFSPLAAPGVISGCHLGIEMPSGWARKGGNGLSREENGLNGLSEQHFPIDFFPQSHSETFSHKFRGLMPTQLARLSPGDLKLHCAANGVCVCFVA